jgi:hypothetical protein
MFGYHLGFASANLDDLIPIPSLEQIFNITAAHDFSHPRSEADYRSLDKLPSVG